MSAILSSVEYTTYAQPYGQGKYGANVPYGGQTALSIATSGNVNVSVTPSGSPTLGTASGTVTVTTSDVTGYNLYVAAVSSKNMTKGATVLGASSNTTAGTLATNTWGFNTDGTANFLGMTTTNQLIKTTTGPNTAGDITTVTYGIKADSSQPAGVYSVNLLYTAVPVTY